MSNLKKTREELLAEVESLRTRLEEADQTLQAIRTGEVDAVVVSGPKGSQVFTLQGADHTYRVLVEVMSEGAATMTEDGTILYGNRRFAEMVRVAPDHLVGSSLQRFVRPSDLHQFENALSQPTGRRTLELMLQAADGMLIPVLVSLSEFQLEDSHGICLVATDLTEQKRQQSIIAAQQLSRSILDQSAEAILVCDQQGKVIRCSQQASKLCGETSIGRNFDEIFPLQLNQAQDFGSAASPAAGFSVDRILRGEMFQGVLVSLTCREGTRFDLLLNASPLRTDKDKIHGCVITLTDITERKRATEALEELRRQNELILTSVGEGIYGLDLEGRITFANPAAATLLGWTAEELIGRRMHPLIHYSKADGSHYAEETCQILCSVKDGSSRQVTDDVFWRKDGTSLPVEYITTPIRDGERILGTVVAFSDITERKRAEQELTRLYSEARLRGDELRDKQEQLVHAGKLATLGEMATGIAHELNNPLNNIGLFLGNVIDQIQMGRLEPERIMRSLGESLEQVKKAAAIISHLRVFGRGDTVARKPCSLHQVIQEALSLVRQQLALRQIEVQLDFQAFEPTILGSAIQLEQIFVNLLTNARDALADVPVKKIRIRTVQSADHIEVQVSDSGPGIPLGLEQRIFDPFFSTKEVGHGTGLGLSISYSIVKAHEGTISVLSPPGLGATFVIRLPLTSKEWGETKGQWSLEESHH